MGTCSSGQARHHQEKELTDVLMMYSKLVQPDVFAFLIDFLKQHEIISNSWTCVTKKLSSAPRPRSTSKAEQRCITSKQEKKGDSSKSLLEQIQQNDNQEDEIKRLTNEIKAPRKKVRTLERRSTESVEFGGDHESLHRDKTKERKGNEVHSTADKPTRLKQEAQITRPNVCLTGKGIKHLNKEMYIDKKQLVPESESIQEQFSDTKTKEKGMCKQSACEEERKHFLSKIKQFEETIGKLQTKISTSENNQPMRHATGKQPTLREGEMAHLSSNMKETEQKNEALNEKLRVSEDEVKALRLNKDQLTRELKTEQQKHHTNRIDPGEQIASLRGDNTALSSTIEKLQRNVAVLERKIDISKDDMKTLRLNKDQLTRESGKGQQKYHTTGTDQGTQLESLKGDKYAQSSTVGMLQKNVVCEKLPVAIEEDLKLVKLNKDHLAQELETVRQEHRTTRTDQEKQRASLRGDNNVLSSKVKTLQQNVAVLETQLGVSQDELGTLRLKIDQLMSELETEQQKHHTTNTDLGKQITSLRGANTVLSSKVDKFQQNIAMLEIQLGVSEDELKTLRLNRDHMTQELETEQRNHHTTRTELGEQIVSLRGDNTVLSSKVGKFQQNVSVLEKQLVACGDELKVVKFNEDILTQELERKQQTCADLEEYIVSLKGDNTAMSSTVEKLKRDVAMMERQLDAEYQQSQKIFLEAGEAVGMLDRQWRVEPIFDHQYLQNIKDEVEQYWPLRDTGVSMDALRHVNILFIGPIGAGKSSFLNSVESAFRGHVTITAGAGSRTKSVTSMYRQYPVLASDNRHTMKLRLCDCRGLEDRIGISRDIDSILEGHMPDDYAFNTSFPLTRNMHGYKHNPSLEDRIHCVVYVLDAETYSGELGIPFVTEPVREQIKTIQEAVDQRGIPQLAILSKVDNICEATKQHTAMVYRSPIIRQRCVDAAGCLGLPPMTVMPMKNYFWETSTKDDISILALYNIRQMLRAADSFLRANHLDELRADKHK